MRKFLKADARQLITLPTLDLCSLIMPDHPAAIIDKMVNVLDTSRFEEAYDLESPQGKNPLHPKILIKVCLYSLHRGRFTTRKMEEDTKYDLGCMYLTGCRSIDHTTFAKFLNKFKAAIVELFSQTVMVATEKNLIGFRALAIDSLKIKAYASYKNQKNLRKLEKARCKVKKQIADLISKVDRNGDDEAAEKEMAKKQRREAAIVEAMVVLKERLAEACPPGQGGRDMSPAEKERIEEKTTINITDHDAQIMQQANGQKNPAYSITIDSDSQDDIITHFQANLQDNDSQAFIPAVEGSQRNTGRRHDHNLADAGFSSYENLVYCLNQGLNALIPDRRLEVELQGHPAKGDYDRSRFQYKSQNDCYVCPQGHCLGHMGVINLNGHSAKRYGNASACARCPVRKACTKGEQRIIVRDDREYLKEQMREKLLSAEGRALYKLRSHSGEAPTGCFKWNWKFIGFLRRTIPKVAMECALLFSLHNILKIGAAMSAAQG